MNYKLLLGIEIEKNKQLEEKLLTRDIEISNLIDLVDDIKKVLEEQNKKIIELETKEPEVVYLSRDSMVYG